MRTYRKPPAIESGIPKPPYFSVIIPIARTNRVQNPSAETNTTGYTAGAGSLARTTEDQYHGAYSLKYTPTAAVNDGFYYGTVTTVTGQTDAISCKFKGKAGVRYKLSIATTGGSDLAARRFTATGFWQWITLIYQETSGASRRIYFTKDNNNSTANLFVDGVQCEACEAGNFWATTYIDGSLSGLVPNQYPPAYVWNGPAHASTSTRSSQTRSGGRVVRLNKWSFTLLAAVGLGLATPNNIALPYAQLDGEQYQDTQKMRRTFSLGGRFDATTDAHLQRQISGLGAVLDRDLVGIRQPLTLQYQPMDEDERATGEPLDIIASYAGGLEGNTTGILAEEAQITFTQHLPLLYGRDGGVGLNVLTLVSNTLRIAYRTPAGTWQALGTGLNGIARVAVFSPDGSRLYVGGDFSSAGGVANTSRVAYYDFTDNAWHAMGAGITGTFVRAIAFAPDGRVYVAGNFTSAGGVANTAVIALYNPDTNTWSSLSGGTTNNSVLALYVAADGTLYLGGDFTQIGGVSANRFAKYTGGGYVAIGNGFNSSVNKIDAGLNGMLYIGGNFTTSASGAITYNYVATSDGSTVSAITVGSNIGVNDTVYALAVGTDGHIYFGGQFTTAGGVAALRVARFNGTAFSALGTGVDGIVRRLVTGPNNQLVVGGEFDNAGTIPLIDHAAVWTGASWVPVDIDLISGTARILALALAPDGGFAIAGETSNNPAPAAAITTVTNNGTAQAYPLVTIEAPPLVTSRVYQFKNYTNGRSIYFNLLLAAGEKVYLNLEPTSLSFVSSFRGNIMSTVLAGSNVSDWFLSPGSNSISFFASDGSTTATMSWRLSYNATADSVP